MILQTNCQVIEKFLLQENEVGIFSRKCGYLLDLVEFASQVNRVYLELTTYHSLNTFPNSNGKTHLYSEFVAELVQYSLVLLVLLKLWLLVESDYSLHKRVHTEVTHYVKVGVLFLFRTFALGGLLDDLDFSSFRHLEN